jgi:hypothetical protein
METSQNQKPLKLLFMNKCRILLIIYILFFPFGLKAQCLSSVNPVGGTDNLLVLEKNSWRVISFYKYGQGSHYYKESSRTDFDLISRAYYNYLSAIIGYGLTNKLTLEIESGYFFNKTQNYNVQPAFSLSGKGLSNAVVLAKHSLFTEPVKRIYITGAIGAKIPFSRELQWSPDNVKLPVEVQPTLGAYGAVFSTSFVKESSGTGMRYFLTNRIEAHAPNKEDYNPGTSGYTSFYISKHLKQPWLKDNVTAILQIRNEIRGYDKIEGRKKESSGSILFFLAPQINYVWKEDWYFSAMTDIPVYQYFKGTQLGAGVGFTFIVSRTFRL